MTIALRNENVEAEVKQNFSSATTEDTVKEILKDGTPKWARFPNDYKAFAKEAYQEEKEASDYQVREYKMEDQAELTDEKARLVNFLHVDNFLRKLRAHGVRVKLSVTSGQAQMMGLHAVRPGYEQLGYQYITFVQIPYMPEWSLLREDDHGLPNGESARGWRTCLWALIQAGILSEEKAHQIFGEPVTAPFTVRYRRSLWELRNHRRWEG